MEVGGRLLDYVGNSFQGKPISGHLDIPLPVRARWTELTVAHNAIKELRDEIKSIRHSTSWSKDDVRNKNRQIRELAARIERLEKDSRMVTALDETFAGYWRNYQEMASDAAKYPVKVLLPDGSEETNMDWVTEGLREQVINAIRRLRG